MASDNKKSRLAGRLQLLLKEDMNLNNRPKKYTRNGMTRTAFYRVWCNMRARCQNPSHTHYKSYGARGINVCAEWESFLQFHLDMGAEYQKGLQLDRIDNNKGYSKNNCRWVSSKVNNRNRRNNHIVETPEGAMILAEAAEKFNLDPSLIRYRIRRGYATEDVYSTKDYRRPV